MSIALAVGVAPAVVPQSKEPEAADRVLGLDTMYINAMLLFLVIGMGNGNVFFFEGALVIAVLGFVTTVSAAKFLMRGEVIE